MQFEEDLEFELLLEDPYLRTQMPQEDREESMEGNDLSKKWTPEEIEEDDFQKSIPQEHSEHKSISKESHPEKKKSIPQDDREESVESKDFSAQTVSEKSIPQEHCDDSMEEDLISEESTTVVEGKDLSESQIGEKTNKESTFKEKDFESTKEIKDASIETSSRKISNGSDSEKKECLSTPTSVLRRPREVGKSPSRSVRFDKTAEKEVIRKGPNSTQKNAFRRLLIARRGKRVIQKVKQREERLNDLENLIQSDSDSSYDYTSSEEESDSESSSSYSENATKSSSEYPAGAGNGAFIKDGKSGYFSKRRLPEGPKRLDPTEIPLLAKPKNPKTKVMPFGMLEDNLDIPMKKKTKKRRPRRGIRRRVTPVNSTPDKKVSRAPKLVPPPANKKLELPNVVAPRTRNHRQGLVDAGSPDFSESQDVNDEEESESLSVGGDMLFYCDDFIPPSTLDEIQERLEEIMKEEKTKEPEVRKQQKTKKYNTYRSMTPSVSKRIWNSNLKKSHSRANSEPNISIREDVFNLLPSESAVFGFAFQNLLHKDKSLQTSI